MKTRKVFLLLIIGAAVILTVIWSTRISKPDFVKTDVQIASFATNFSKYEEISTSDHSQCSVIPNVKGDIDTSDIYPTLNFNVSSSFRGFWGVSRPF